MKNRLILLIFALFSLSSYSQIICSHLKCVNEFDTIFTFDINELGEDALFIRDFIPLYDSYGEDSVFVDIDGTYTTVLGIQLTPYSGCVMSCNEGRSNNCITYTVYDNGIMNGPRIEFFESGEIRSKGEYLKGQPIGEHVVYSSPFVLKSKSNYDQNGKLHGLQELHDEYGITVDQYEHGKFIGGSTKRKKK